MTYVSSRFAHSISSKIADCVPSLLVAAVLVLAVLAVDLTLGHDKAQAVATLAAMGWSMSLSPREAVRSRR
jgi:hypothetical protein